MLRDSINISTNEQISINELVTSICHATGYHGKVHKDPAESRMCSAIAQQRKTLSMIRAS